MTSAWHNADGRPRYPPLRPSLLVALPRITAYTRSSSTSARSNVLSTTTDAPSARTKPFADSSPNLHLPSAANMP
jgi:hypothetical protein